MARPLLPTGHNLTRRDFYDAVLRNRRVSLAPRARRAMEHSRAVVERLIAAGELARILTPTGE